jgi:hypothetical protein
MFLGEMFWTCWAIMQLFGVAPVSDGAFNGIRLVASAGTLGVMFGASKLVRRWWTTEEFSDRRLGLIVVAMVALVDLAMMGLAEIGRALPFGVRRLIVWIPSGALLTFFVLAFMVMPLVERREEKQKERKRREEISAWREEQVKSP